MRWASPRNAVGVRQLGEQGLQIAAGLELGQQVLRLGLLGCRFQQSLYEMGISKESHTRMVASQYLYQHLAELASDPSSDSSRSPRCR